MLRKVFISLTIISLAACGGSGGADNSTSPPVGNTPVPTGGVSVRNDLFSPDAKTVAVGTAVHWSWNSCEAGGVYGGSSCTAHSVTFDDGETSALQDQGTYTRTFTAKGTYNYHCQIHGAQGMVGTITVQ
jgi:plastocyanin